MRVITGECRGKKLKAPEGVETRPTSEKVKEAVFSAIQFDVAGSSVLDLFAGSGQMGIEALSRGASHCVFVDNNAAAVEVVKSNVNACGMNSSSRILNMNSLEYLKVSKGFFDIVFLDPPYRMGMIESILPILDKKLNEGAVVVCEHEKELELPEIVGRLCVRKRYKYGKISVTIYIIQQKEE